MANTNLVFVTFLITATKCLTKAVYKWGVNLGLEFRVQSILVGEAWWQVQGAGVTWWPRLGSRLVNAGASFAFTLVFRLQPRPKEWC